MKRRRVRLMAGEIYACYCAGESIAALVKRLKASRRRVLAAISQGGDNG
jgi:hypothetical protein